MGKQEVDKADWAQQAEDTPAALHPPPSQPLAWNTNLTSRDLRLSILKMGQQHFVGLPHRVITVII